MPRRTEKEIAKAETVVRLFSCKKITIFKTAQHSLAASPGNVKFLNARLSFAAWVSVEVSKYLVFVYIQWIAGIENSLKRINS